ncbi:MAG: hypothetical protein IKB38_07450 [Clostridia bacterium]|nr:hypothetical protein [Clostridia bacterium]
MDKYREQALLEYNCEKTAAHPGGVDGRPFWNLNSSQFMFVPTFQFPRIPGITEYLFTAEDKDGKNHSFKSDSPTASLAPIWADIPVGIVCLKVESVGKDGEAKHLVGARTFYKSAPFPGRSAFPPKARSYRECALAAFRYIYNEPMVQHWLINGTPMPDYPHNVYPSKTIDSVIRAMVHYAKLEPSEKENALKLACRAADYLLSISFEGDHPLAGLPPTYSFKGLDAEAVNKVAPAAQSCVGTMMMIYPISAGIAYLTLAEATGDDKYLKAALRIAEYYKANVLPSGSWYLLYDCESGKPLSGNVCVNFKFIDFFHMLYEKTNDEAWHDLEIGCYKYIVETCLKNYNWEGQFEDVAVSGNYQNLTHFTANNLIGYISKNLSEDEKMKSEAQDLMRYVEDQFVVWGEHPDWNLNFKEEIRHYPAGLEQYFCYAPIDSSTTTIMGAFANMYTLTKNRLYLEKAMALADAVTRNQDKKTGMIPTFWVGENCEYGYENFWINCQLYSATAMMELAELTEKEGIN